MSITGTQKQLERGSKDNRASEYGYPLVELPAEMASVDAVPRVANWCCYFLVEKSRGGYQSCDMTLSIESRVVLSRFGTNQTKLGTRASPPAFYPCHNRKLVQRSLLLLHIIH